MICRIRPGKPDDLPEVAAIQCACPEAANWPPADYLQHDFHVAVVEDRVRGFLVARQVAEDEREIMNVAVAPDFRRKGIARALLISFFDRNQGVVFLEVRASNSGARGLYKSLGFQEVTLRRDYYHDPPEGAIVMKFHS